MIVLLVTGGRDYQNRERVESALEQVYQAGGLMGPLVIVEGGCPTGADLFAREWAQDKQGVYHIRVNPLWDSYGKMAGPFRNRLMLDAIKIDQVFAFPGGRGTANCLKEAQDRNIPRTEFR